MQELIDGKIVMSMRTIYQSKVGITLIDKGTYTLSQTQSMIHNICYCIQMFRFH